MVLSLLNTEQFCLLTLDYGSWLVLSTALVLYTDSSSALLHCSVSHVRWRRYKPVSIERNIYSTEPQSHLTLKGCIFF